jgi:hypothetical protein
MTDHDGLGAATVGNVLHKLRPKGDVLPLGSLDCEQSMPLLRTSTPIQPVSSGTGLDKPAEKGYFLAMDTLI